LNIRRTTIGAVPSTVSRLPAALDRARLCANVAADNRGREILIIDLRKLTTLVDFFVIASGTSRRQIHAMADEIDRALAQLGEKRIGIEGYNESHWVLLDYGDIVVHLFDDNTRRYYDLENLWGDAPRVEWEQAS
jgi:ribosome-associated protein